MVLKLDRVLEYDGGIVLTKISLSASGSVGLGWGLSVFIPKEFPAGSAAALGNPSLRTTAMDYTLGWQALF